jgi:hypothetical protein
MDRIAKELQDVKNSARAVNELSPWKDDEMRKGFYEKTTKGRVRFPDWKLPFVQIFAPLFLAPEACELWLARWSVRGNWLRCCKPTQP